MAGKEYVIPEPQRGELIELNVSPYPDGSQSIHLFGFRNPSGRWSLSDGTEWPTWGDLLLWFPNYYKWYSNIHVFRPDAGRILKLPPRTHP